MAPRRFAMVPNPKSSTWPRFAPLDPHFPSIKTLFRGNVARRPRSDMPRKCWASPQLQSKTDPDSGEQRIGIMVRPSRNPSPNRIARCRVWPQINRSAGLAA